MRHRARGFFVWEVTAAVVLLAAVGILLVTSMHTRQRVDDRMAARLSAMNAARAVLLHRQDGSPVPQFDAVQIESRTLDTPAPAGKQWIAVRATAGEERVELVGQVPVPQAGGGKAP